MTVIFASNFASIEYSTHCTVVYVPVAIVGFLCVLFYASCEFWKKSFVIFYSGPPIIFESVLFVLTMVKFYIALRDGWGQEPMISRFLKDGIWAFALPFGMCAHYCEWFRQSHDIQSFSYGKHMLYGTSRQFNFNYCLCVSATIPQRITIIEDESTFWS